jgi:hypothetical protein
MLARKHAFSRDATPRYEVLLKDRDLEGMHMKSRSWLTYLSLATLSSL